MSTIQQKVELIWGNGFISGGTVIDNPSTGLTDPIPVSYGDIFMLISQSSDIINIFGSDNSTYSPIMSVIGGSTDPFTIPKGINRIRLVHYAMFENPDLYRLAEASEESGELACLVNLIGISGEIGLSKSGLYINTLPNINTVSITKIADEDQADLKKVFDDIEKRTINRFRTAFIRELNQCWKIGKRDIAECLICENKELLAVSLQYLTGIEMLTEQLNSSRINRYTSIDKITAQRTRVEFEETFRNELHVAVLGIDIPGSGCYVNEDPPEARRLITYIESTP